jgi:Fe2+ or Zn2+ uptake regulation protein/O6-methylguanine-DNA--protein-cysteine methyltransferase
MSAHEPEIAELLRRRGLRSTPQRRAILIALHDSGEHLSADEVHARASRSLPHLGRGTVYAALTELSELGVVSAFGLPEPVRYEANTTPHGHFRCRLCMRLFDLDGDIPTPDDLLDERFAVERVTLRAEGVCAECRDYEVGLLAGIRAIHRRGPAAPKDLLGRPGLACAMIEGPLGLVALAATPAGLLRLAFEDHADAGQLREHAASRRGSRAARGHLRLAREQLASFMAGDSELVECPVDSEALGSGAEALRATTSIPYDSHLSYSKLDLAMAPQQLGLWMGANPLPIVFPCHRVSRGTEVPDTFVGGLARRRWLEEHERERRASVD